MFIEIVKSILAIKKNSRKPKGIKKEDQVVEIFKIDLKRMFEGRLSRSFTLNSIKNWKLGKKYLKFLFKYTIINFKIKK